MHRHLHPVAPGPGDRLQELLVGRHPHPVLARSGIRILGPRGAIRVRAVQEHLDAGDPHPAGPLVVGQVWPAGRRQSRPRVVQRALRPQPETLRLPEGLQRRAHLGREQIGDGDDPALGEVPVEPGEIPGAVSVGRLRYGGRDARSRRHLDQLTGERPVRMPAEPTAGRVGAVGGDPGELQRPVVAHRGMPVAAADQDRLRAADAVQVVRGRAAALWELRIVVAEALNPRIVTGTEIRVRAQGLEQCGQGRDLRRQAPHRIDEPGHHRRVRVHVEKSRHDGPTAEVDRRLAGDVRRVANPREDPVDDAVGRQEVVLAAAGEDLAVDKQLLALRHARTVAAQNMRVRKHTRPEQPGR